MFWNLENFFNTYRNTEINDEQWTPRGEKRWTRNKYQKKCNDIAKTILLCGDSFQDLPAIIGVSEVENRGVLEDLLENTVLSKLNYEIVHHNSPDKRGIDVGLLYDKDEFTLWDTNKLLVSLPDSSNRTRDILHVEGYANELNKKMHIIVNHWPSKWGGEKLSAPSRLAASLTLKPLLDSLTTYDPLSLIVVMGDFNDTPESECISKLLSENIFVSTFIENKEVKGTIKYQGKWEVIDMFIINDNLMSSNLFLAQSYIFSPEHLLEEDRTYLGYKPYRNYLGPIYHGGVSDHLPIILNIVHK